ncbi:DUF4166 domain-containing protein [Pilimelia columellifera]|uniref:DUF4166 domain-containing protein n=1 Tax=Pilimelia columellifera subsp. columellifera TaxID=706583 RepID=A0ABN3NW00_9ACTN
MTAVFRRALGADFHRLHPRLRERFGFSSNDRTACVGRGLMEEVWRGRAFTLPFLHLGATRNILFPERGRNVPFVVENYAYLDTYGRETLTFTRSFVLGGVRRRFDATMIYSPLRGRIIDYLGTHQHLAVDLDVRVDDAGGLRIVTGAQRFYEGLVGATVPAALTGQAEVHEWYDERRGCFRISVRVANRRFGALFGYRGWFVAELQTNVGATPARVRPVRESARD